MKRRTPRGPKASAKEIEKLDIALSAARDQWMAADSTAEKARVLTHLNSLLDERSALAARLPTA